MTTEKKVSLPTDSRELSEAISAILEKYGEAPQVGDTFYGALPKIFFCVTKMDEEIRALREVAKAARYALKTAKFDAPINKQLEASRLLKNKLDELEVRRDERR